MVSLSELDEWLERLEGTLGELQRKGGLNKDASEGKRDWTSHLQLLHQSAQAHMELMREVNPMGRKGEDHQSMLTAIDHRLDACMRMLDAILKPDDTKNADGTEVANADSPAMSPSAAL